MTNTRLSRLISIALILFSIQLASVAKATVGLSDATFLPYPVLLENGAIVPGPDGVSPQLTWDGTLAELMAADAYGQCWRSSSLVSDQGIQDYFVVNDSFLEVLAEKMDAAHCSEWGATDAGTDADSQAFVYPEDANRETRWALARENPRCNVDPTTGRTAAITPLDSRNISGYINFYAYVNGLNDYKYRNFPVISELGYAELNLCIAQRLSEQTNSASTLFASAEDQLQLAGFIRERAQLAMLQYALFAKAVIAAGDTPSSQIYYDFLSRFRDWALETSPATKQVAQDFAASIRLQLTSVNDFAQLLRRQASARPQRVEFGGRAAADWGNFSPRVRLLNLLYGGDPLTTTEEPVPGRGEGGVLRELPFVTEDMRSPEVETLIGLTRLGWSPGFIGLKLIVDPNDSNTTSGIDVEASASNLYYYTELLVRELHCAEDDCDYGVPDNPADYLLWTRYHISLEHARILVRALGEAYGHVSLSSIPRGNKGYGFNVGVFHFLGVQTLYSGEDTWLYLDPSFSTSTFSATELSTRFDGGDFIPANMNVEVSSRSQGFFGPFAPTLIPEADVRHFEARRALGAVQALTIVRETLVQAHDNQYNSIDEKARAFFEEPEKTLPDVEKAIGTTTVALRPMMDTEGNPVQVGNFVGYTVDMLQPSDSPWTHIAAGAYLSHLDSIALDPNIFGDNPQNITPNSVNGYNLDDISLIGADDHFSYDSLGLVDKVFDVNKYLPYGMPGGVNCGGYIERVDGGKLRFSVTYQSHMDDVEAYIYINGVVTPELIDYTEEKNSDGTFTYSQTWGADMFTSGDQVKVRFVSRETNHSFSIYSPGDDEDGWSQVFEYGQMDDCNSDGISSAPSGETIAFARSGDSIEDTKYLTLNELPRTTDGGYYMSFGGSLNALAERVWAVDPHNWSMPKYDAFDLPMDWMPPSDASLVGGVAGQESYEYFLNSAETAAEEATTAVQTAIEALVKENDDVAALDSADQRASGLSKLEEKELCGASESCNLSISRWLPPFKITCPPDDGTLTTQGWELCQIFSAQLTTAIPNDISLPTQVIRQLATGGPKPDFSEYSGGELGQILVDEWVAARDLVRVQNDAVSSVIALAAAADSADRTAGTAGGKLTDALQASHDDLETLRNDAAEEVDQVEMDRTSAADIRNENHALWHKMSVQCCERNEDEDVLGFNDVASAMSGLMVNLETSAAFTPQESAATMDCWTTSGAIANGCGLDEGEIAHCFAPSVIVAYYQCLEEAGIKPVRKTVCSNPNLCGIVRGYCAGWSYSGKGLDATLSPVEGGIVDIEDSDSRGYSDGPRLDAVAQCDDLREQYKTAQETSEGKADLFDKEAKDKVIHVVSTLTLGTAKALDDETLAREEYSAALAAQNAAHAQVVADFGVQQRLVDQAVGEVLKKQAALNAALGRTEVTKQRYNLDRDMTDGEIQARFGLRRKFRSYDLWRSRALLESARRMAVAARRAIEERFVVNLSDLEASQTFVEAPSVWADEIYDTDLAAPAAVGLSLAPKISGAVYPNKLKDYVANLRRFVQGYTVTYPTSVAAPDTEVITLPGPDVRLEKTDGDQTVEHVSSESTGWQFHCSGADGWILNPGLPEYPIEHEIDAACDGAPPDQAKITFSLDPWGRLDGDVDSPPYVDRHNVRWRRLAVNLTGTGIRDCQRAADPVSCYSDSFVRYDLKHTGPSWVTNHSQEWREYQLPTAIIEGAKALATEEWLDPISNSWNQPFISNVARSELSGRLMGGTYELVLDLTPDIRLERIESVQVLAETDYWVRQN